MNTTSFIDDSLAKYIEIAIGKLRGRFIEQDIEDLRQNVYLKLFKVQSEYDKSKSRWNTFAERVVDNTIVDFIRVLESPKIAKFQLIVDDPLNVACVDGEAGESVRLVDLIPDRKVCNDPLAMDIHAIVEKLPREYRMACECYMRGEEIKNIPALIGVTEAQLNKKMKRKLRKIFAPVFKSLKKDGRFSAAPNA